MVSGHRPYGLILGAGSALAAATLLMAPPQYVRARSDDDPYERPSHRPRPLPDGPCSYRATGSKRSRRRRRGKAKVSS